ncbi:hypothetical protein [Loktanella sp. S4079]|uniref:hypothetical protein n=1 Tax=Loktanella sp. S4079 TaxID=579483 RepID=UPI0005FA074E|nr:hypothetical protein [Loktanella sp. S4079]KJZ17911.1 hypothetical protein TW80_16355 [Loktanella sp. S4079]
MKIWIVITDDSNGIQARPFSTEAAADAAAHAWCAAEWLGPEPCPVNWRDAYKALGDFNDTIWIVENEIDATPAVEGLLHSAKAQLANLLHQVYQMQGVFNDEDGSIQRAVEEAEQWPALSTTASADD